MAFVDNRLYLCRNLQVPSTIASAVETDRIDLLTGDVEVPLEDMWLVINVDSVLDGLNTPLLAFGLASTAAPATALLSSTNQHWQFGNIDLSGVVSVGLGIGSFTGQLMCARMNRITNLRPARYLGMWMSLANPAPAEFTEGLITAYLTSTPPTNKHTTAAGYDA